MSLELLILDGPHTGQRLPVWETPATLGRTAAAGISFPQDNFISGTHLSFQADPRGVLVNDLRSTNGTFINGQRVSQAIATLGDIIKIGSMNMRVVEVADTVNAPESSFAPSPAIPSPPAETIPLPRMDIPAPPPFAPPVAAPAFEMPPAPEPVLPYASPAQESPILGTRSLGDSGSTKLISALNFSAAPPAPSPSAKAAADARKRTDAVQAILRETPGPLFCLLNAGADETIPAMLAMADVNLAEHCLLEVDSSGPPPRWAPYLLPLPADSPLLPLLVEKGWGKGWGNFFTSFAPFEELRTHFRKFLMVQVANGAEPYFRFYEPATLRGFLTAGSPTELTMFFGPIDEWMLESENKAEVLKAWNGTDGLATTTFPLTDASPVSGF